MSNINIPCGATTISLSADEIYFSSSASSNGQRIWNFEGSYEIYEPQYVEISINGSVTKLELSDETVVVGDVSEGNPFSVNGNELLQTTNESTIGEPFVSIDFNLQLTSSAYYDKDFNYVGSVKASYDYIGLESGAESHYEYLYVLKSFKQSMGLSNATTIYYNTFCEIWYNGIRYDGNARLTSVGDLEISFSSKSYDENFFDDYKKLVWLISADYPAQTENSIDYMFSQTISEYNGGKETATILCSIGKYYDENGLLVVSEDLPEKMCFDVHDEVIPMVLGANGTDIPMSKRNDSTAKKFIVLSVKPIYDGAVWQQLVLQEA